MKNVRKRFRRQGKKRIAAIMMVFLLTALSPALAERVEKDTDNDGKIDRIAVFTDEGKIEKLEIDSNRDGETDRFQFYENETVVRIERDTDFDGRIDVKNYLENETVVRQECLDNSNTVYQVTTFNDKGEPVQSRHDLTDDGFFETEQFFNRPDRSVVVQIDDNEDGKADIWEVYDEAEALIKREKDIDFDGTPDITKQAPESGSAHEPQQTHNQKDKTNE